MKITLSRESKRELLATVIVCLLPMVAGAVLYGRLPDPMPIHFGLAGEPNGWGPKPLALFGLPALTAALQVFAYVATESGTEHEGPRPRLYSLLYWMIPLVTMLVYTLMLSKALGANSPVGKLIMMAIGILFMALGNYTPKVSYAESQAMNRHHYPKPKDEASWRRQSRIVAYLLIGLGALMMVVSLFVW